MIYKEKTENTEREYSIKYNSKEISELINDMCDFLFINIDGTHDASLDGYITRNKKFHHENFLPNGQRIYTNIKSVSNSIYEDLDGHYHRKIEIEGTKTIVPELAYILYDIKNEKIGSFERLLDYENHDDMISKEEKIKRLSKKIDSIDNLNYELKIKKLQELKNFIETDTQFNKLHLQLFYSKACALIDLNLLSEKTININTTIPLCNYKRTLKK